MIHSITSERRECIGVSSMPSHSTTRCPLCDQAYETEMDLRVHLEVEHRKSDLAVYITENGDTDRLEWGQPTPSS